MSNQKLKLIYGFHNNGKEQCIHWFKGSQSNSFHNLWKVYVFESKKRWIFFLYSKEKNFKNAVSCDAF